MKQALIFLLPFYLFAFDFHDFDLYQNQFTAEELKEKIEKYLEKDSRIQKFYNLTPQGLHIGKENDPDYVLRLKETPHAPSENHSFSLSLKGLRVAIDPGHFGGEYAELEKRCIKVLGTQLNEGDMAYLTALKLKELLEGEGAIVMVTRSQIGKGVLDENFTAWLAHQPKDPIRSEREHFIRYNREDLYARAEKINAFHPDITLILHYNSENPNKDEETPLVEDNYSMVFVPGAFLEDELERERDRYEFLRLLLSDSIKKSILLSKKIAEKFSRDLKVPLVDHSKLSENFKSRCLFHHPGVYSRNLALTRLIHSPVCYGEPLIQNDQKEARLLGEINGEIQGIRCSKRLEEVAKAYFEGIKDFCREN